MAAAMETRTVVQRLAFAIGAGLVGLVVLPLVFGGLPDATQGVVWLGLAITDVVCLLAVVLLLIGPLASLLLCLPINGLPLSVVRGTAQNVARLAVAAMYLVLMQAVLRRPLVAVFGTSADPFVIEASVAIAIMLVVALVLIWLHAAASPVIEDVARHVLDASLATSSFDDVGRLSGAAKPLTGANAPEPVSEQDRTLLPPMAANQEMTVQPATTLSHAED